MVKKMSNIFKIKKTYWIIYSLLGLFLFISLSFPDINISTNSSYNLLDELLNPNISFVYEPESAFYVPIHMIFAVWNLPLWLLSNAGFVIRGSYIVILWSKMVIALFFIGTVMIIRRFYKLLNTGNIEFWIFALCSSLFIFLVIFDMVQYDIFGIFFGLLGIYYSICEERLSPKTLLLLSFALSFKFLFVFAIINVILLKSKKIRDVIINLASMLVVPLIFIFINSFIKSPLMETEAGLESLYFIKFTKSMIISGTWNISLLFVALFSIYLFVFEIDKPKNKNDYLKTVSWSSFFAYFSIFAFGYTIHAQWQIFMGIFLFLLLPIIKTKDMKILYYEIIFELSLLIQQSVLWWFFFYEERFYPELYGTSCSHPFSIYNKTSLAMIIQAYDLDDFMPVFASLFFVLGFYIVFKTCPYKIKSEDVEISQTSFKDASMSNYTFLRLFLLFIYTATYVVIRFLV